MLQVPRQRKRGGCSAFQRRKKNKKNCFTFLDFYRLNIFGAAQIVCAAASLTEPRVRWLIHANFFYFSMKKIWRKILTKKNTQTFLAWISHQPWLISANKKWSKKLLAEISHWMKCSQLFTLRALSITMFALQVRAFCCKTQFSFLILYFFLSNFQFFSFFCFQPFYF